MREQRIYRRSDFLALPRHDIDGIMQQRVPDFRRRFGHENPRVRMPSHHDRERSDVIEMRVRDDDRIEFAPRDHFQIRQRRFAFPFRMHARIEDEALPLELDEVGVRADLRATRQVEEFQS